jgi:3-dehydroquinate dehydratase
MKIFDIKNSKHVQILKEELIRARRILREYNEADIWKRLTIQQREELLSSVNNEMGADFAAEYAESEWLEIPDAITNRIDISKYTADYAKSVDKSALTYARGIFDIIFDETRFKNTKQLQDFIAKTVGATSTEPESLKMALMQYARDNSAKMMRLNIETQKMAQSTSPMGMGSLSGATIPSRKPGYMGGAEWTGD